jgi:non-ribosomal peptide synthetase component F
MVVLDRGDHLFAAHLGILKAGAAFVMIDSHTPITTFKHMLDDARPAAVILNRTVPSAHHACVIASGISIVHAEQMSNFPTQRRSAPSWLNDPETCLAAVYYTSGTTGMPKGVALYHAGPDCLPLS